MLDHVSITVKDLDRSCRFYREAFGLADGAGWERKPQGLRSRLLVSREGAGLELVGARGMKPDLNRRERNGFADVVVQEGFTHISFSVDDMEGAIARVVRLGGRVIEVPRAGITVKSFAFVEDPDGIAIELVERE